MRALTPAERRAAQIRLETAAEEYVREAREALDAVRRARRGQ